MSNRRINVANPIVLSNGTMDREFLDWVLEVSKWLPTLGEGSPEGNVEAPQYSLYIDTAGSTGSIEYRKMLPDIGGDKSQGWVAV